MASGLSGSPTEHICLRLDKSYLPGTASPAFINIRIAVGAVYHTVTLYFSIISYQELALKPPSYITCVIPLVHGADIPYDVPVTHPGSAVHQYTSESCRSSAHLPVIKCCRAALCACTAPFGFPVVPDV